jgi:TatD DNase family protein
MIDSHIHLTHEKYSSDLNLVVENAKNKGVKSVVLIGCNYDDIEEALKLSKTDSHFFKLAIGYHPVDIAECTDSSMLHLRKTLEENKVCAIGEIGLDYHWYPNEKKKQIKYFKKQIEMALEYDLPIIVHSREAYDDCYDIIKEYTGLRGVMHSFAGTLEQARKYVELGFYIGLSGPITFKNGENQKNVAKEIDLSKILIETDGPYLTPEPYRGKRNLPEYIQYVAQEIAFQKKISLETVLFETEKNTNELFGGKNV